MMELIEAGKAILGPQPGATLLLFFACGIIAGLYWREKRRNEKKQDERLAEVKKETELFVTALNEATQAVREFKSSNDALRIGFEALASSISSKKDR